MNTFSQAEAAYLAAPEDESPYRVEQIEPGKYECEHAIDGDVIDECGAPAIYEITDFSDDESIGHTWLCEKHFLEWEAASE